MVTTANADFWQMEGERSYAAGWGLDACPYLPGTAGEAHWKRGWRDAYRAAQTRKPSQ